LSAKSSQTCHLYTGRSTTGRWRLTGNGDISTELPLWRICRQPDLAHLLGTYHNRAGWPPAHLYRAVLRASAASQRRGADALPLPDYDGRSHAHAADNKIPDTHRPL